MNGAGTEMDDSGVGGWQVRLALAQIAVGQDKQANMAKAQSAARAAKDNGADLLALPEMFTCPYEAGIFAGYAETYPDGPSVRALRAMAIDNRLIVVGGSLPELADGLLYNTCFIFGPDGVLLGRHRKTHLFDVDLPGGLSFQESATLSPGATIAAVATPLGRIGIGICYDMRFPELVRRLVLDGARLVLIPAAFNLTTGPAHWEVTLRARAIDNQVFVAGISRARVAADSYVAYAHSMAVDPWGGILGDAGTDERLLFVDVDQAQIDVVRSRLPLLTHRRPALYQER